MTITLCYIAFAVLLYVAYVKSDSQSGVLPMIIHWGFSLSTMFAILVAAHHFEGGRLGRYLWAAKALVALGLLTYSATLQYRSNDRYDRYGFYKSAKHLVLLAAGVSVYLTALELG